MSQTMISEETAPHTPGTPAIPPNGRTEAIFLLAHGTPDTLGEMADYLHRVTGGRPMPAAVVEELQHRYAEIGLAETAGDQPPPLTRWTLLQAHLLEAALERTPLAGTRVYTGMRNWHPFIADTIAAMRRDGITRIKAICLAPQNSRTSVGLYRRALLEAAAGPEANPQFDIEFVAGWADNPFLVHAFADRLWPAWAEACARAGRRVPVLFTAHSVPCRTIRSGNAEPGRPGAPVPADGIQSYDTNGTPDPYPVECKRTAALIADRLRVVGMRDSEWFFAFQSQGVAGAPWIGPSVEDSLKALAAEGHTAVVLQPVGFLCDHVEILYDIDIAFTETARELGMTLTRAECLNDSPLLIDALVEVATGAYHAQVDEHRAAAASV